jgi:hypothetical protein
MPTVESSVITCAACQRQFAWKRELAGKRVRCKCGDKITVPGAGASARDSASHAASRSPSQTTSTKGKSATAKSVMAGSETSAVNRAIRVAAKKPKPVEVRSEPADLDGLMALAEDADRAAAAMPIEVMDIPLPAVPVKSNKQPAGVIPLGYQRGPTALETHKANRHAEALMDPVRDLYAPIGFLTTGLILYMSYWIVKYNLPSAAVVPIGLGVFILTAVKTLLLVGFALMTAGPLGVSFGSL